MITYDCSYKVVFCTKYRTEVLTGVIENRLKEILRMKEAELNIQLTQLNISSYHVDLMVKCNPQDLDIHKMIKNIKNSTSSILRSEFDSLKSRLPSLWTNSYFIKTIGVLDDHEILEYISSQKKRGQK